jgi:hypothetical protein
VLSDDASTLSVCLDMGPLCIGVLAELSST